MLYIGIDLGTSAVKLILMSANGDIKKSVSKEYPLYFPQDGWSEQHPGDWWNAVCEGVRELTRDCGEQVDGISFGGQMHGLVILDEHDNIIRPAILWNDGRTTAECAYLNETIGKQTLTEQTANIAFTGFTAPKLLWLKEHEPENFARIKKIMLPKDYLAYCMTGVHCTDVSDASGMLLFDVKNRCWSKRMTEICSISESQLPQIFESSDVVGSLTAQAAQKLNLSTNVRVIAGAGDNAAAAVGTGTVGEGKCNLSLGTSGTVFISGDTFRVDAHNALHSFAHSDGAYHLMGCILSAASCNKWWLEQILNTHNYAASQQDIQKLGENNIFFLPYLMGERSPHNDASVRGCFLGLSLDTSRADMTQAVLEGVAFAMRDSIEVARSLGLTINSATMCGGGAKSPLWCKIMANVLRMRIDLPKKEEGPAFGAAILAAVGCGAYRNVREAAASLIQIRKSIEPEQELMEKYEEKYHKFRTMYPAVKTLFE